jgi:hypothetical protein
MGPSSLEGSGATRLWHNPPPLTGRRRPSRTHPPCFSKGHAGFDPTVHPGGSGPAFKTCLQPRRAGAPVSSRSPLGLTRLAADFASLAAEATVRPRGFPSMKPTAAPFSSTASGAGASSALRLSVVLPLPVPSIAPQRGQAPLSRPAKAFPASWAPALPVSGTPLLPSPGAAARAGHAPRASQGPRAFRLPGSLGRLRTRIQNVPPAKARRSSRLLSLSPWSNPACSGLRFARR